MKLLKLIMLGCLAAAFVLPTAFTQRVEGQTEAPTGFGTTNGLVPQGTPVIEGIEPSRANFEGLKAIFEERDGVADGLGPVYNAQSCAECHQNPVTGGISQITELRAGRNDPATGNFVEAAGGSLINDRATNANIQERVPSTADNIRTFRTSLNVLGDGFVEAIDSNTLAAISNNQPAGMRGQFIQVPVAEAGGAVRGARFGWKNQQASLLSFSSDAYLNEQGITNRFNLVENTSNGRFVGFGSGFDPVADNTPCDNAALGTCGEDPEDDISAFATFMRATRAPARNSETQN
ncbi:MAG: hypothetical protein LC774_16635, partial [Acidobacteria bacterium]|nr:hypothetical protein [Acidobacteriota bacterium]